MTATSLTTAQIRRKHLDFFRSKGHLVLPSHSVIAPDPTTMFTVAGMQPFKPQFMGTPAVFNEGENRRVATAQKCVRLGDIENVGRTRRHLSLFEMLGNFSFGDYFKAEAIRWAWEFLTSPEWLGFDKDRLYVTIYEQDDEAFELWTNEHGVDPSHIHRFGADENFWPADAPLKGPNGPCGPCSEIYYDRGPEYSDDSWADYANTRESARFLEIWNLVFPEFDRQGLDEDGQPILAPLPFKNIDTGMGLERVASIVQDVPDFYSNDVFKPLINAVAEASGQPYEGEKSVSHRVVAEHVRAITLIVADGVEMGNVGRAYVARKILRRASRHAYMLGISEPFLYTLTERVAELMADGYPELNGERARVAAVVKAEEERFLRTLQSGIERLGALLAELPAGGTLGGAEAFTLYDTYGFPLDLTAEIAAEGGFSVDEEGYNEALAKAQDTARAGSKFGKGALFDGENEAIRELPATEFLGFEHLSSTARVLAAWEHDSVQTVVLDRSVFYAEGGGQVGDVGEMTWSGGRAEVQNTRKNSGVWLHDVAGNLPAVGAEVSLAVNESRRDTERHHTATHLLHAALQAVLGDGVKQAGSLVTPERLRFDFRHGAPLSAAELQEIEQIVNRWIRQNSAVTWQEMPIDEARALGATALFGEKYGDVVRVVRVQEPTHGAGGQEIRSMELCGGAHVRATGQIGGFVILGDENVSAGVRRIEALAGSAAVEWTRAQLNELSGAAALLGTSTADLSERTRALQASLKAQEKEIKALKTKLAEAQLQGGAGDEVRELGGWKVAQAHLSGLEGDALRTAADRLLDRSKADMVVVVSDNALVVKASKDAAAKGAHAGKLASALATAGGGRGGGRPDMAQAGIGNPEAALAALESALG